VEDEDEKSLKAVEYSEHIGDKNRLRINVEQTENPRQTEEHN